MASFSSKTTEALVFDSKCNSSFRVSLVSLPLPSELGASEVLVKMLLAPINPLDLSLARGLMGDMGPNLGTEGLGEVIHVGSKVCSVIVGDRVVLVPTSMPVFGTFRKFIVLNENSLAKIPDNLSLEQAATLVVNPSTAFCLLDSVPLIPGDYILQNAANSALGRAIIQLSRAQGLKTINIIRNRPDFDELSREMYNLGADIVLSDEEFKNGSRDLEPAMMAIDCVGGEMGAPILKALSRNGMYVVVENLSRECLTIDVLTLMTKNITLRPFILFDSVTSLIFRDKILPCITNMADFQFPQTERVCLSDSKEAFDKAASKKGNQKVLLVLND